MSWVGISVAPVDGLADGPVGEVDAVMQVAVRFPCPCMRRQRDGHRGGYRSPSPGSDRGVAAAVLLRLDEVSSVDVVSPHHHVLLTRHLTEGPCQLYVGDAAAGRVPSVSAD